MLISLVGDSRDLQVNTNGDQLAKFYHCAGCGDMVAVGCMIEGRLRGAVNSLLLEQKHLLGPATQIRPRLLSAGEKLDRWSKLWGSLEGV